MAGNDGGPHNFVSPSMAFILFGIFLRIALYAVSTGSNDIRTWEEFARLIDQYGLKHAYSVDSRLNHPPLACFLALWALSIANLLNVSFVFTFKFFPLLADIGTIFLVGSFFKNRGAQDLRYSALYALCVPAILISAYHGNTDSLCLFFTVASIYFLEIKNSPVKSALLLALAINIKIIPLILLLPLLASLSNGRDASLFLGGIFLGAVPFILGWILLDVDLGAKVFAYRSFIVPWGFNYFLWALGEGDISKMIVFHAWGGKLTVAALLALSFVQSKRKLFSPVEIAAISFSLFLIFAPGFGIQYLIYVAPFIMLRSFFWGVLFNIVGGVFSIIYYNYFLVSYWPLTSYHSSAYPVTVSVFGALAWAALVCFLWCCRSGRNGESRVTGYFRA